MAVVRVHKNENYTVMSNRHFKEKKMSLKAKGLLSLMLSLPETWDYSIAGLVALSKDGRDSVMSALDELKKFGYLKMTRIHDENGKFGGYDYDIFEEPQNVENYVENYVENSENEPKSEKPKTAKPNTEKPKSENPQQLNTNNIKYIKNKDKIDKIDKREIPYLEPSFLTKELINKNYIEKDDLYINDYNDLFLELTNETSFEIVRSALGYILKQVKIRNGLDENRSPIENKFAYLKNAMIINTNKIVYMNERREKNDSWLGW